MEFENMIKLIQTVSASELDSFCYEENGIRIKCGKNQGKRLWYMTPQKTVRIVVA